MADIVEIAKSTITGREINTLLNGICWDLIVYAILSRTSKVIKTKRYRKELRLLSAS